MNHDPSSSSDTPPAGDSHPADRLLDTLLREQARHRSADESLIASIETALDLQAPAARSGHAASRRGLLLASAAALALAAGGLGVWRYSTSSGLRGEGICDLPLPPREARGASDSAASSAKIEMPPPQIAMKESTAPPAPPEPDRAVADIEAGAPADSNGKAPTAPASQGTVAQAAPRPVLPANPRIGVMPVRFLAWDEDVAARKISVVSGGGAEMEVIKNLHPLKRTGEMEVAASGQIRMLQEGRTNPDGTPAFFDISVSGYTFPLVIIVPNDKSPAGITAIAIEDDERSFKWGSYLVFNATKDDLAMVVDKAPTKIPVGWKPVSITPKNLSGPAQVELRAVKDLKTLQYSMVWNNSPDLRRLVIIIPTPDPRLGAYLPKVIQEQRLANADGPLAASPDRVPGEGTADIAARAAKKSFEAPPMSPIAPQRRLSATETDFTVPDPTEDVMPVPLPPGDEFALRAGQGGWGSGGGSGGGIGTGTGPGAGNGSGGGRGAGDGTGNSYHSLAQKETLRRQALRPSDALPAAGDWPADKTIAPVEGQDGERYGSLVDQPWKSPWQDALSTFSIDVDSASYTNLRRMIRAGQQIPKDAVRIEECVNYFDYNYSGPKGDGPFAVHGDVVTSPLQSGHLLARVAIKGREMENQARPASNLVFLIDVSGSMQDPMKLPLVQRSLKLLVEQFDERDHLGIVVYAGTEGVALESTRMDEDGKSRAMRAISKLGAGGSTNGGAGIMRAYEMAAKNFITGGVNRVILATDGDFNVGNTGQGSLVDLVKEKAKTGVNLTVTSVGEGNLNDSMLEAITKDGNGNYYYLDSDEEARRIFLQKMTGTLVTIAKDVKIQVEFNPSKVKAYRLLGYADRILRHEDFNNDKVDAGDIGAGHTVTAFYEIVPDGVDMPAIGGVDPLKYQKPANRDTVAANSDDWFTLKLRYKAPDGDTSSLIETPIKGAPEEWEKSGNDLRFAASVALFGMKLRDMPEAREVPWSRIEELAQPALSEDPHEQRAEFLKLVQKVAKTSQDHDSPDLRHFR